MTRRHIFRSVHKDMRDLVKEASKGGFKVSRTRSGHVRFVSKDGQPLVTSGTPSDIRAVYNARAALRRMGLPVQKAEEKGRKGKKKA